MKDIRSSRSLSCTGVLRFVLAGSLLLFFTTITHAQPLQGWKRPGLCNTGPTNESIIAPSGTIKADTEGEVIENVFVTGIINVYANNVTIRNFKIDADSGYWGIRIYNNATGLLIEDGEIYNYLAASVGSAANYTARRMHVHESEGDGTGNAAPSPYQFHAGIIMQCNVAAVDSVWVEDYFKDTVDNLFDPMGTSTMPECDWSMPVAVSGLIISPSKANMAVGENLKITATIIPVDAGNQQIIWSSIPDSVASVDSSGKVSALRAGRASIVATSADGNFTDSCSVSVEDSFTSMQGRFNEGSLVVYPNPSNGELHISFSNALSEASVLELIDLSGQVVQSSVLEIGGQNHKLILENQISPGVYILKISNREGILLNKIIVE